MMELSRYLQPVSSEEVEQLGAIDLTKQFIQYQKVREIFTNPRLRQQYPCWVNEGASRIIQQTPAYEYGFIRFLLQIPRSDRRHLEKKLRELLYLVRTVEEYGYLYCYSGNEDKDWQERLSSYGLPILFALVINLKINMTSHDFATILHGCSTAAQITIFVAFQRIITAASQAQKNNSSFHSSLS